MRADGATALLRPHWRDHHDPSCSWCQIWLAYSRRDLRALDEIIGRLDAVPDRRDEPVLLARAIRNWGEANWTARDIA